MNRLIIAAAGSGKTTYLINEALKHRDDSILLVTYTIANEVGIREKFIEKHGCIPANVTVFRWFSFLLKHGVKPYQGCLYDGDIKGIDFVTEKENKRNYHPEKDTERFYFSQKGEIYSDKIAKFVCSANTLTQGLVIKRIFKIFQHVYIDEIQDMTGYDLEIIKLFCKESQNVLMVGDPRQVTYHTHFENKNKKYINGGIAEYVKDNNMPVKIDEETLNHSYRNHIEICTLANKLYPNMPECTASDIGREHVGIYRVLKKDLEDYIKKYKPMQLRYNKKTKVSEHAEAFNFGNAKGLGFERVIIYPTKPIKNWLINHSEDLKEMSRSKLYVAITRAMYSVAFVDDGGLGDKFVESKLWKP